MIVDKKTMVHYNFDKVRFEYIVLEEVLDKLIDYRGKTPRKTDKGIPLVTAKIIKDGGILPYTEYIAEDDYDKWMTRGLPLAGDIVITTEAPLGEIAQLDNTKIALAQRIILLRGKKGVLHNGYLKYIMQTEHVKHQLNRRSSGSTVIGIKQSELRKITIPMTDYETQKEIAHILGTLDDKIELNRKMNKTLEEIAQTLFKHWFIDFEFPNAEGKPYKSSGGEMIDSELGIIPKGWRVGKVSDEFDITMSQSPPGDTYNQIGDGLPFYQGNADFSFRFPQNRVYCTMPKRLSQAGDTLLSVRAPVGDVNMSIEKSIIGRGVASIQHKHRKSSYTYCFVKAKAQFLRSYDDSGTVFGCITKSNIGSIDHVIPIIDIIDKYNVYTTSTDSLIHRLHIQTDILNQSKKIYILEML